MLSQVNKKFNLLCPLCNKLNIYYVVKNGYLKILKSSNYENAYYPRYILRIASLHGHLELLKLFYEKNNYLDITIFDYAAVYGYLNILKWGRENNFVLDAEMYILAKLFSQNKVLKWFDDNYSFKNDYFNSDNCPRSIRRALWIRPDKNGGVLLDNVDNIKKKLFS